MRLAFTGASGTGKTSIASEVAEVYGIPLCPVGARTVAAEMGFKNPYEVDAAGKRHEFVRRLLQAKSDWEAAHNAFVTDRAHFDNLVYTIVHNQDVVTPELTLATATAARRYTNVILCRTDVFQRLGADPTRRHEPEYHAHFQSVLVGLLERHWPNYGVFKSADVDARLDELRIFL